MMRFARASLALLVALAASTFALGHLRHVSAWTTAVPGVQWRRLTVGSGFGGLGVTVVAVRTTPERVHVAAGSLQEARGWRESAGAIAAVNGGFFDGTGQPVGMLIASGKRIERPHHSRGGVFFVRAGKAAILDNATFLRMAHGKITEAIQCSPVLAQNGRPNRLKPQEARRTAIGIQANGRVVIAVADGPVSLPDWAQLWVSPSGLSCRDALNLDGGPSTQLSLKSGGAALEIPGGWPVPDAVIVR